MWWGLLAWSFDLVFVWLDGVLVRSCFSCFGLGELGVHAWQPISMRGSRDQGPSGVLACSMCTQFSRSVVVKACRWHGGIRVSLDIDNLLFIPLLESWVIIVPFCPPSSFPCLASNRNLGPSTFDSVPRVPPRLGLLTLSRSLWDVTVLNVSWG